MRFAFQNAGIGGSAAAADAAGMTAYGLFTNREDLYLELQKWKRCASP
jgi:hypothetical protein